MDYVNEDLKEKGLDVQGPVDQSWIGANPGLTVYVFFKVKPDLA